MLPTPEDVAIPILHCEAEIAAQEIPKIKKNRGLIFMCAKLICYK
jgi:hypothetical protein